MYFRNF